ncbi:asparagine synthase (glutamine-hydrolyzing) [Roseivirga sp. E12]|uniref:asparagine synthase (glutamine-hydrolyzing) n=1 Tax=Roseivirga sp. E12 TaxID=2819237 RepID=UPI001ABCC709|nr:asparagine synthase (glutamine-hydrolyzing) [Roseivirga sp. E12]MBO3699079.1 asparagine synthase (glutamine-hydrolyzing) [Roseivirga sp. E12]
MCGIAGYFSVSQKIERGTLEQMGAMMHHRGPDALGIYQDQQTGLVHNRLSLLDLSINGNQPFEDEDHCLIYNGEIYNFQEIRKKLPALEYKSGTDTEVLFKALKFWGLQKTLVEIKGMYAFAWYNKQSRKLYLVRDRLGIKPLFYGCDTNGTLWFASEVKAIHKVAEFVPDPITMLYSTLGALEKSSEQTAWRNLKTLSPGHFLEISTDSTTKQKYHSVIDTVDEQEYNRLNQLSLADVTSEFDHLMSKSVTSMLVSDAPMGVFVSGGVDSSLIASYSAASQDHLKFFTADVVGQNSEFKDANLLAKTLDVELFDVKYHREEVLDRWAKTTWYYESPITTHFNALPFAKVSQLAHEHQVKAVLTGEGSDELFLGYPKLLTRRYDKLINSPFTLLNKLYGAIPKLRSYINKEGSGELKSKFELAALGFERQMLREQDISAYHFLNPKQQQEHYLTAQMLREGIVSLLWRNDRMGMMNSLESRFPFLDENIVAFGMNLPVKFKIGRSPHFHNYKHPFLIDKSIVRSLAKKTLPKELSMKKKKGFPVSGLYEVTISPKFFTDGILTDILRLNSSQLKYMHTTSSKYHIALLASFEIWAKLFVKKESIENVTSQIHRHIKVL